MNSKQLATQKWADIALSLDRSCVDSCWAQTHFVFDVRSEEEALDAAPSS